jgi:hypothetical protein
MGLNYQDSMAVANIVITGLAMISYMVITSSSNSSAATTSSHKKTTSHRASSVGGKTRKRH